MRIVYPPPLAPGDRIAVIAPSSGVPVPLHPRLDLVLENLRSQGFVVEEGQSLRDQVFDASASADQRADELMRTLLRSDVQAIFPPWGGELAIELLHRLDWEALQSAAPKWCIGYSDSSTWMLPLTLRLGWAIAHGPCAMDLVPGQQDPLTHSAMSHLSTAPGGSFLQRASTHWQKQWTDFAELPDTTYRLTDPTHWRALNRRAGDEITAIGRVVGGCLDTLMHLHGTPYADVPAFVSGCGEEGAIVYLENAEQSPSGVLRALLGLRAAGWFEGITGLLLGRSAGPNAAALDRLSYVQALQQSVGDLPCPVLFDVDIGHVPPQLLLINGALAQITWPSDHGGRVVQTLV